MAHYDITYTCGHEETIELFGKVSERERRIEWLESQPCVECARKESIDQAQSRLDACIEEIKAKDDDAWQSVQKIIEAAETQLDGSLKQVSWASEIRLDCMSQLVGRVRLAVTDPHAPTDPQSRANFRENLRAIACTVAGNTKAAWWIDNRRSIAAAVMHEAHKAAARARALYEQDGAAQ